MTLREAILGYLGRGCYHRKTEQTIQRAVQRPSRCDRKVPIAELRDELQRLFSVGEVIYCRADYFTGWALKPVDEDQTA